MKKLLCLAILFGAFSASAQRFVRYFDTVTDMAASNPADPNVYVVVGGSVSFNDNQAARWKWVSGLVDPADGNTVVSTWAGGWPGKPAGRWKKINEASGIVIDTSGFITNYNVVVVNDKASLQNINVTNNIAVALVKGKYGMNDGWEGQFTFNAASTAVADDAFYVAPNTGVGMWERQTPNPLREIPATWFDPNLTNGVIQAAINYAASLSTNAVPGREVLLPPKFIEINGNTGLNMSNNVTLVGQNGTVLATSAGTVAGYQMIRANGVTNWGVKNLQLIGLASVGGYGIFVTNSSRGVWGGITFATNFTSAPVWITNSSEIVPFDDKWIKNSVRAYGAQGNNLNDDTVPFSMAVRNTPAQVGDRVIVPPGSYANNLWLTSTAGLVLEALNQGGQGVTNYTLTPFDPSLPVIRIGTNSNPAGYPNRSITMRGLMFDYRGPTYGGIGATNTYGQIGLSIRGGVESVYLDNCEWQGFSKRGVELVGGSVNGAGVENITFNNPNIQLSGDSATNDTYGMYLQYSETANGPSDLTFVSIFNGKFNGANEGFILKNAGVHLKQWGGYYDGNAPHMIVATNWGTAAYPFMEWIGTTFDNHNGGTNVGQSYVVFTNEFTGSFPWLTASTTAKEGTAHIKWNGKEYPAYDYAFIGTSGTNMLYNPMAQGTLRFNAPGDYYEAPNNWIGNDSAINLSFNSTNGFVATHEPGNSFSVNSKTNAALNIRETIVDYVILSITITNLPSSGVDIFSVNNRTSTWVNVVTDPPNEIAIGVSTNGCATALYNYLAVNPYTQVAGLGLSGPTVTVTFGVGSSITNLIASTNWCSTNIVAGHNYGIATLLQHANVTRIIPGGDFHLDNAAANAVMIVASNAAVASIVVNTNGVGINQSAPTHSLSVGFNGGLTTTTEMSVGQRVTNSVGSHAALDVEMEANPTTSGTATNVAANYFGIYSVARTTGANTNNFTGSPTLGNRFETRHDAAQGVGEVDGLIVGPNTTNSGAGWITNSIGLRILDQTIGATNWAVLSGLGRHAYGGSLEYNNVQTFTLIASDQIQPTRTRLNVGPASGNVILTNVPTILPGYDGQVIFLTSVSSNTVELIDKGVFGWVTSITVSGGSNYAAPPAVDFSAGGGTSAAGTAEVSAGGVVTNIIITNPGDANYVQNFPLTLTGGGGSNTTARAYVSTTGLYLGGPTNLILNYGDTKIFVYNPTIGLWCLAGSASSGGAVSSDNWVASGTTNSSLPGRAYMDSVQVTNNTTGTGKLVFGTSPTFTDTVTLTNGTVGTVPFTINHASGATADALNLYVGGVLSGKMTKSGGWRTTSGGEITVTANAQTITGNRAVLMFDSGTPSVSVAAAGRFTFASGADAGTSDTEIRRDGAASIQLGNDAASPIHQTLKAHDASGTDKSGANLTLKGGYGTGTGRGGDLITMTSVSSNTTGAVVQYYSTRHYESAKPAPVTNSAACPLFNILVNTNHYLACKIFASTFASDVGGDFQAFAEELNISAVNKAGTIASTVSTSWGTNLAASSASTLTTTWTAVTSGNSLDIKITPVSSLTPTTYYTKWKVDVLSNDPATITPQ